MKLELFETTTGYQIIREGFNGCGHIDIWCGTLSQALEIMKMIIDEEGGFNR